MAARPPRDGGAPKTAKPGKDARRHDSTSDRKPDRKSDAKPEFGRDQTLRLKEGAGKPKHGKKPFRKDGRPSAGARGGKGAGGKGGGGKGAGFGGAQPLRRRKGDAGRPARGRP